MIISFDYASVFVNYRKTLIFIFLTLISFKREKKSIKAKVISYYGKSVSQCFFCFFTLPLKVQVNGGVHRCLS